VTGIDSEVTAFTIIVAGRRATEAVAASKVSARSPRREWQGILAEAGNARFAISYESRELA
jgi:hypothetical protein